MANDGRLAQLGEHLPYKQRVIGSSPILSTNIYDVGSNAPDVLKFTAW